MGSFCKTEGMLFELLTRILCDVTLPRKTDLIYLYGQTSDNEDSVLNRGIHALGQNLVRENKIGICGLKESYGYPGAFLKKAMDIQELMLGFQNFAI